jgi:HD-GYP domain-containing protein (c-di-GMP phosphodiesterase class II)
LSGPQRKGSDRPRGRAGDAIDVSEERQRPSSISRKFTIGFALMSLVPILLAIYLVGPRAEGTTGFFSGHAAVVILLMLASAVAGFHFIRAELARVFLDILDRATRTASGDLSHRIRQASQDEIGKISETIERITAELEQRSEEAQRSQERMRHGITELARALQSSTDESGLPESLVKGLLDALCARTVCFVGVDEEGGDFVTLAAAGDEADRLRDYRLPLGEGIPGRAARERRPLLLRNTDVAGMGPMGPGLSKAPKSTLAVPLLLGETLHGVLVVYDRREGDEFTQADLMVLENLASLALVALGQSTNQARLEADLDSLLGVFARAVEERDPYARGRSDRMARYCEEMARALKLDGDTVRTLRRAALMHGIGKVTISDAVLHKEGALTDEELEHLRKYPVTGERILRGIPALASVWPMVRHHNERADGSGYPDGLKGDEIPLTTHLLIAAHAFELDDVRPIPSRRDLGPGGARSAAEGRGHEVRSPRRARPERARPVVPAGDGRRVAGRLDDEGYGNGFDLGQGLSLPGPRRAGSGRCGRPILPVVPTPGRLDG